jgi:hypothetical protein
LQQNIRNKLNGIRKLKIHSYTNNVLDTSSEWLLFSIIVFVITILLHSIANGWVGPWPGHNFYNDPKTSWIGTYPVDIMHFLAGFSIASIIFNFNLGRSKRSYILVPVLTTIILVQVIGLLWEWVELAYFGMHPGGFIQVDLRDTLFDETMDVIGGAVAVLVGERFTV